MAYDKMLQLEIPNASVSESSETFLLLHESLLPMNLKRTAGKLGSTSLARYTLSHDDLNYSI
jgi:hypothetical protein